MRTLGSGFGQAGVLWEMWVALDFEVNLDSSFLNLSSNQERIALARKMNAGFL